MGNPIGLIFLVLLVLFILGGLPNFGYHTYGWYPSGGGLILLILLLLLLFGRL